MIGKTALFLYGYYKPHTCFSPCIHCRVAVKPHASPMLHSIRYLLGTTSHEPVSSTYALTYTLCDRNRGTAIGAAAEIQKFWWRSILSFHHQGESNSKAAGFKPFYPSINPIMSSISMRTLPYELGQAVASSKGLHLIGLSGC